VRGLSWRGLAAVAVAAPVIGVIGALLVVDPSGAATGATVSLPAVSRSVPPQPAHAASAPIPTTTATRSSLSGGTATGNLASAAVVAPGLPAFVSDPGTVAQVAQDLIVTINVQSKGAYAIAATPDNLTLFEAWMANEGGLWANNPLNTSLEAGRYPHQITTTGVNTGIPIFPDIQIGAEATATTLLSNHDYAVILSVLSRGNAPCTDFAQAVIQSPWASSHYGYDPSRFCGGSVGSGGVSVVSACLRLPGRGQRVGGRTVRAPGDCGRYAEHASRVGSPRPGTPHHPGTRHSGPDVGTHPSAGARRWRR
jgi:hypothetical protein